MTFLFMYVIQTLSLDVLVLSQISYGIYLVTFGTWISVVSGDEMQFASDFSGPDPQIEIQY